jgi:hypothetical protein
MPVLAGAEQHRLSRIQAKPHQILATQERRTRRIRHPDQVAAAEGGQEAGAGGIHDLCQPGLVAAAVAETIDGHAREQVDAVGLAVLAHVSSCSAF